MKFTRSLEEDGKERAHGDNDINTLMPWDTFCLLLRRGNFKIAVHHMELLLSLVAARASLKDSLFVRDVGCPHETSHNFVCCVKLLPVIFRRRAFEPGFLFKPIDHKRLFWMAHPVLLVRLSADYVA